MIIRKLKMNRLLEIVFIKVGYWKFPYSLDASFSDVIMHSFVMWRRLVHTFGGSLRGDEWTAWATD